MLACKIVFQQFLNSMYCSFLEDVYFLCMALCFLLQFAVFTSVVGREESGSFCGSVLYTQVLATCSTFLQRLRAFLAAISIVAS